MATKAPPSGRKLTATDAAIVKGMLQRGDRQHDIASYFGVNGGRIAEVSTGATFKNVAAQTTGLPPAGPYLSPASSAQVLKELNDLEGELRDPISGKASAAIANIKALCV